MERKATYIRAWREKEGYTLAQMVGRLDALGVTITEASLSRIERGKQPYSQDILEAIAAALGKRVSQLIEDDPAVGKGEVIDFMARLCEQDAKKARDVLYAMFGAQA